jgi:hypothetical protein
LCSGWCAVQSFRPSRTAKGVPVAALRQLRSCNSFTLAWDAALDNVYVWPDRSSAWHQGLLHRATNFVTASYNRTSMGLHNSSARLHMRSAKVGRLPTRFLLPDLAHWWQVCIRFSTYRSQCSAAERQLPATSAMMRLPRVRCNTHGRGLGRHVSRVRMPHVFSGC